MVAAKCVLFDFDGTLMNTWPGIERTIRSTLKALDIPIRESVIDRALVGIPLSKVFQEILGSDSDSADLATRKYRELFPLVGIAGARPYKGVPGMLRNLRSGERDLFLVTARNETIARQMLSDHGLSGFFNWVRGEREDEVSDGKSHMVAEVLKKFSLIPGECVLVGDRRYDMDAAKSNGVPAVGVTYGYGTKLELLEAGAARLAGSIAELEGILLNTDSVLRITN
jgi:phosphoglycolate phosphatase